MFTIRTTDTASESVRVYGRNSMTWDDDRKAAAYVTAQDTAVLNFARSITSFVQGIPRWPHATPTSGRAPEVVPG